ncbi:acyl-CoA dehydrogenase family protein [Actinomadura rugatobispora]|uniref:Acyl-CoA dehydrogenase family protein n=1 Tax=Actinomadura rugatobispora TaxID=1994 RepID=A0ABW0ZTU2_9ACTN|nr:acyl-CoA dehydrogenase family protein [Actinomadura rugatobispora]
MLDFDEGPAAGTAELRERVRALTARWRDTGRYEPRPDNWMRGFDPEFSAALAAAGLIGLTWPVEYGGAALRNVDRLAVTEELLRAGAPVAAHWMADRQIGPAVLRHGSEELRRELLPDMVAGRAVYCLGMSEPEAGSDLASVRTTATERPDGTFVLRGRKVWTTNAHRATHMYVLARTDPGERKHEGLSEFIIDMDTPGITVSPIPDIAGEHHFNEVLIDDAVVPARRIVGERGRGWSQVVEQLSFERGGPERALSSYILLAGILAGPRAADGSLDVQIGQAVARLAMLRRLAYRVARLMDNGAAPVQEAATLKLLGNTFEQDLVDLARQAHDGPLTADSLVGQALMSMPGFTIRGGAADVMLSLIARQESVA